MKKFLDAGPLTWGLLKEITDDFSEERLVGRGGFGDVYKGVYGDGHVIAVKRFKTVQVIDDLLQNEINILSRAHHQNIIQLVGYCFEREERVVQYNAKHVVSLEKHSALCYEYMRGGSLEQYISPDMRSGLDWQTQYRIIKGMCEGLRYLHDEMGIPVIHMDLKPSNIYMDDQKMVPIIGDFGLARFIGPNTIVTARSMGSLEYMPPEFIDKSIITKGHDIYSLGVVILQLMTGKTTYAKLYEMSSKKFIELEHEKWRKRLQKTVHGTSAELEGYCQQVKKCLEIAVKCVEKDRHRRPAIRDIIHMLNETEIFIPQLEIDSDSELLLEVHPLELHFTSLEVARNNKAAMMSSSCSLQLKNKGNDRVAFMIVANSPKRYLTKEPLCGVVPPRCAYTLTVTMRNTNKKRPSLSLSSDSGDDFDFFTLYSVGIQEYSLLNVDKDTVSEEYDNFFKEAKEEVQEVMLNVICDRPAGDQRTSSSQIVTTTDAQLVSSIDVHPAEPWIMTTNHPGSLRIWNYKTMEMLKSFGLAAYEPVHVAKFVRQEKWLVAGDCDGGILVYNYENDDVVESFDAHGSCITTLVVHPTSSFVLSSSEDDDHLIKLWDWGNGWKCTRFGGHTGTVTQVTLNTENNDCFASASLDGTVKVWSICSDDPSNIITLKLDERGLCADYFTRYNRQHMIVGCKDKIAQIWELVMKGRVHELEGHEDHISAVNLHPELPVLITGSLDGTIRVWDSTTYKLENIIGFNLGAVYAFGCIKGSRRIVVGCHQGIAIIEIPLR